MDGVRDGHPMIISVEHIRQNGWHEFSCPQVPGFSLVSDDSDLEAAYAHVPTAIAEIIEADEGFPVDVILEIVNVLEAWEALQSN